MRTYLDDDMSICSKVYVIMQLDVHALTNFDDCASMMR